MASTKTGAKTKTLKSAVSKSSKSPKSKATKGQEHIPLLYNSTPTKPHPILSGYFGYCLGKSMLKLKEDLIAEFNKLGIMPPQAGILDILSTSGPLNQLSIGEEMGVDKASMVKIIDSVEALGLVERKTDPNDRRAKTVEITAKGKKLLPKLKSVRQNVESRYLSALTKEEAEIYRNLTRKIFLSRFVKKD